MEEAQIDLRHYDGVSAVTRWPRLYFDAEGFVLEDERGREGPIGWEELRWHGSSREGTVYDRPAAPGWRLVFGDEMPAHLAALLPRERRYGSVIDRLGLVPSLALGAAASIAVLIGLHFAPAFVAPLIPYAMEQRLGDALAGDMGGRYCSGKAGQQALDRLAVRLSDKRFPAKVRVMNVDMNNAAALPGGTVLLFNKLIAEAQSPDEVAGVIAHEMGHVVHRDSMAGLLREAGLSILLGGANGLKYVQGAMTAGYSREAERQADTHARSTLVAARIDPRETAGFFRRMQKKEGGLGDNKALGYLSTHPLSGERARYFDSAPKIEAAVPAMTSAEWQALRHICAKDPEVDLF